MRQPFTFKSVLLALLVMISCAAKAATVQYQTDDGFTYTINLDTQEADLTKYTGNAASVVIPENIAYEGKEYKVTSLGDECFYGCSSLASIEIPSSVKRLGEGCFYGCSSLASIEIPSSVKSLGKWCFSACSSLETIVVDGNNPCYDSREGCNAIIETASNTMIAGCKSAFIPSSVTSLGKGCFLYCSSLVSVEIPSSVTSLGDWCFHGCSSLASIEIPSSVTSLEERCFSYCSSLETIVVDANNPCYDSREGCNAIIETASNTMIQGCKNTFIPSAVTSLGYACFSGCSSLASIEIPSSVTSIGGSCFDGCFSLKTVICRMENVKSGDFFGYYYYRTPIENATLYVPELLLSTYQTTSPWSSFGTILPLTEEELGIGDVSSPAVALRSAHGNVMLSGLADDTPVSYYSVDGRLLGRTSVDNGSASFSVKPNSIVTVKAGKQSFKVRVK